MSGKTTRIISIILLGLVSALLCFSAFGKFSGAEPAVTGLTKVGFGPYIKLLGVAELLFVVLLWIPTTYKIGFFLILSYLGGAAAIEIGGGSAPIALIMITLAWIGIYLKDKSNILPASRV